MSRSIFPTVEVTQIRSLQVGTKALPDEPNGVVGPVFKRYSETKVNGYAIDSSSASSISLNLTSPTDSQYIDYDSVEVQLVPTGTGESVTLNSEDKEVIPVSTLLQNNLEITDDAGFYKQLASQDLLFYPSTKYLATYNAVPGDWLYMKTGSVTIFNKIKQVLPVLINTANLSAPLVYEATGDQATYEFSSIPGWASMGTLQYIVAINKTDRNLIKQFKMVDAATSTLLTFSIDDAEAGYIDEAIIEDFSDWNWFVYDMPLGSLKTYGTITGSPVSTNTTYKIYSYNMRVSVQGKADGKFGRMVKTAAPDYIFMPDKREGNSFFGAQNGHYLRATNRSDSTETFDFLISNTEAKILKVFSNAPSGYGSSIYTFSDVIKTTEVIADKSFLVAVNKTSGVSRIYRITANGTTTTLTITNTDFADDGASTSSHNNDIIASSFSDWNWFIYRNPAGSILLSPNDADWTSVSGGNDNDNVSNYNFTVVDTADFYVSGKQEITILNHISDSSNLEIGLADVLVQYNVLETAFAGRLWDITTAEDRSLVCGIAANYNPLGLATGLLEITTANAYKVIPTDIALSERDPDAPKAYTGKYTDNKENYHDVTKLDWTNAYGVLTQIKDTQIPYHLTPLSQDTSVTGLSISTVTALSVPSKMKEMITTVNNKITTEEDILTNINIKTADFSIVDGKLRYKPSSEYIDSSTPASDINFLNAGIKKGDYVVARAVGTSGVDLIKFKIVNIYSTFLDLGSTDYTSTSDLIDAFDSSYKLEIKRILITETDIVNNLVSKVTAYNGNFRVKFLLEDRCDIQIDGTLFENLPGYYAAVAYAGMANNLGPVSPKTNWAINGIVRVYNSAGIKFSVASLELLGEAYYDILTQDSSTTPVYSKRQFMADGSEQSGVEIVDELAKYVRKMFRPYLGKYNINKQTFNTLDTILSSIIETYDKKRVSSLSISKGLTITGTDMDRLSLALKAIPFRPFNGLDVEIEVV